MRGVPTREDVRVALATAVPIMLGYVSIGLPCGVMEAQAGLGPLKAFILSCTFYTGAGQFMMASMTVAGMPLASIIASVSLVSTRQILYSVAFSPYVEDESRSRTLAFAATVTDESFGVNLDAFASDEGWTVTRATLVNLFSMVSWATGNAVGSAVGSAIALPLAVMSFAMTAIFICLLVGQSWNATTAVTAIAAASAVVVCKLVGLSGVAVFVGAIVGVIVGMVFGEARR